MTENEIPHRLTRSQLVEFLRNAGYPVTIHALNKSCMPSRNDGPPIDSYWGKRPLYEATAALRWAEARLRPVEPNVGSVI